MSKTNPDVDDYIEQSRQWQPLLQTLRTLILECGLTEEFKWRAPCYTFENRNVLNLGHLKKSCTLGFFKGVLLQDPRRILTKPGPNSRSVRVIRFTTIEDVSAIEAELKACIQEAMELERSEAKVDFAANDELDIPQELHEEFDASPEFEQAFQQLTPGRQRGYLLHFSSAKQAGTRRKRIEKFVSRILDGKGIHDCVCGLSKKMPGCDGSHKFAK